MFYFIRTRPCPESTQNNAFWSLGFRFGAYECVYDCPSMGTMEKVQQLKNALIAEGIENDVIIFTSRRSGLRRHTWESESEKQKAWESLRSYGNDIIAKADKCYEAWYRNSAD